MSMREAELGCVFKNIFCVSDCVCFLNAPFSSYRPKTKTTAVSEIIPGGKGRGKIANHAGANTNTYPPCHDVHQGSPSQFLTPRAQPAQMDILQKHKHTRASDIKNTHTVFRTGAERDLCACVVLLSSVLSVLLSSILTLPALTPLTSSDPDSVIPARRRHNTLVGYEETDGERLLFFFYIHWAAETFYCWKIIPSAGKAAQRQWKLIIWPNCSTQTNTMWLYIRRWFSVLAQGNTRRYKLATYNLLEHWNKCTEENVI